MLFSDNDTLAATPKPTPRKSLSAELDEKYHPVEQENTKPEMRKNRFAKLAQNINTWEDDLSHPVITYVTFRHNKSFVYM